MFKTLIVISILAMCIAPPTPIVQPAGEIRGATFFYLDGVTHDFPWVIYNQGDTNVRAKIDNTLDAYSTAGINWVRLLIAADHFPANEYPAQTPALIGLMNNFLDIVRSHDMKIEIVFVAPMRSGYFIDEPPFNNDKAWIGGWMSALDLTDVDMVMIAGDAQPCRWDGVSFRCFGDSKTTVPPVAYNNGYWLKEMWAWFHATYPNQQAAFEVQANDSTGTLLAKLANWMTAYANSASYTAISWYVDLGHGATWQQYATVTQNAINVYRQTTSRPLWLDEVGHEICISGCNSNALDRDAYITGVYVATTCWINPTVPKFVWVGGQDYPYTGDRYYGFVDWWSANTPMWSWTWGTIGTYNTLTRCP